MKLFLKIFLPILILAAISSSIFFIAKSKKLPEKKLTPNNYNLSQRQLKINDQILKVELAETDQQKSDGLSGRVKLDENQGMLFRDFPSDINLPAFWMKGMNFDLDLIWIRNNRIVGITPNIPKPTTKNQNKLPLYYPPSTIDSVLEVNAGWSKKHNIKISDSIVLN